MEDIKRVTGIKYGRFILQTCPPTHLGPENAGGCPHWMFMYVCMYIYTFLRIIYLVGGIPTPLENMKVSWDYYSQYMEK